ncbi:MAG TPA: flagellar biosynthetic protein FliO [Bryobacterales bacterium]|nr:flagellar biosynthetic protein FliO [Bryobacterales bacterium]
MLNSIAAVALVLAMLAGLLWWLRRLAGKGGRLCGSSGRHIRVIESVNLAPGAYLHLIEVSGRALLVSAASQGCELLYELEGLPDGAPAESPWRRALFSKRRNLQT